MNVETATVEDVPAVAVLFREVFVTDLPFLPVLHTADEDRAFFAGLRERHTMLVARAPEVVGFIVYGAGWVHQLYVHSGHQSRGIGAQLLDRAKAEAEELQLWTFQRNAGARRFYARHGFVEVKLTDGANNEEHEPDVLLRWRVV